MLSLPQVHLVDTTDPACWPAWTDNWRWELPAADMEELESAAAEADADAADRPRRGMSFPALATQADRNAFAVDVAQFYATNRGA